MGIHDRLRSVSANKTSDNGLGAVHADSGHVVDLALWALIGASALVKHRGVLALIANNFIVAVRTVGARQWTGLAIFGGGICEVAQTALALKDAIRLSLVKGLDAGCAVGGGALACVAGRCALNACHC